MTHKYLKPQDEKLHILTYINAFYQSSKVLAPFKTKGPPKALVSIIGIQKEGKEKRRKLSISRHAFF